jgi:hypothetical protein
VLKAELAQALAELDGLIQAAEGETYAKSIRRDAPTFDRLVKLENRMQREFRAYFKALAPLVVDRINWNAYRRITAADEDQIIQIAIQMLEDQRKVLLSVTFPFFDESLHIGADAASNINHVPYDGTSLEKLIQRQAIRYSNQFVKQVDTRTRDLLKHNLRTSIDLGEDVSTATKRIMETLGDENGIRARAIARTEPVNAYGRGIHLFGDQTGASGKVLDVVNDSRISPICAELHQKYGSQEKAIPLNKLFKWSAGGGGSKSEPGFHVHCRTGIWLVY